MNNKNEKLQNCLKDFWEHRLKHNPTFATYIGDHRYDDALEDLSEESITAQTGYYKDLLSKIKDIDTGILSSEDKINYSILKTTLHNQLSMFQYRIHYLPMDQMSGPHIDFPQLVEFHPFKTPNDFGNYIARLNAFPRLIDQVIENLQKGIRQKITAFKKNMELAAIQVETFAKFSTEDNPLYSPTLKMGETFSVQDKKELAASIKEAIASSVTPAYTKLFQYLSSEYIKHCREKEGLWALPDGADMYRFFAQYHTTTELSPEEIHKIGMNEVERIGSEIKKLMRKIGFNGSIREFTDHVKEKKDLYPENS